MCGKIKIPLRKSKNDQKNFPLARKRAREQKFPHPQTAYNLRGNGARHPLVLCIKLTWQEASPEGGKNGVEKTSRKRSLLVQ
jgi:hypothetical protein